MLTLLLHRLFLISIILSMKFHEEYYIENSFFYKMASKFCSIHDVRELNQLETVFLDAIDFRLSVQQSELNYYFKLIHSRSQELQCRQFKIMTSKFEIIEDYFKANEENKKPATKSARVKLPLVFLNGKLFKDSEEVFNFFNCDEICWDKTSISKSSTLCSSPESSPRLAYK